VSDDGGRIVEQLPARTGDAFQQFGLFTAEQTGPYPAQVGAETPDAPNPLAREAEVESVKFIGLGRSRYRATIDFGQESLALIIEPGGSRPGVNQIRSSSNGGPIGFFIGGSQAAQPVAIDVHIVVEESHDLITRLGDRPVPGVTKTLARLVDVTEKTLERRGEFRDNLRGMVATVVIDDENLVSGRTRRMNPTQG
jgi:hypothetical protein